MTKITITCQGGAARARVEGELTAGAVGVPVEALFDEEWAGLTRRGKVRCGDVVRSLVLTSGAVVPWECLIAGQKLEIGVDGISADGNRRIPTVWACCGVVRPSAAETEGENPAPAPSPTLMEQIQKIAENMKNAADSGLFNGRDGHSPRIGAANTWLIWDDAAQAWVDTGIPVNRKGDKGDPGGSSPQEIRSALEGYLAEHPVSANVEIESSAEYRHRCATESAQTLRCLTGVFPAPNKILLGRNYFPEVHEWLRGETYRGVTFHSDDGGTIHISGTPTANDTGNNLIASTDNLDFVYEELQAGDAMQLEVYSTADQPAGTQIQVAVTAKGTTNTVTKINLGYGSTTPAGVQRANLTLPAGFTALNFQIVAKNSGKAYDNTLLIVLRRTADSVLDADGAVTLPVFAPEVATYPHPSVMTYQVNPKEYTDAKFAELTGGTIRAELGFLTPEQYGARGDNTGDDTAALNACLADAAALRKAVRGYGRYRCAESVVISGNDLDVELYQLTSGEINACALRLDTLQNSRVCITKLTADTTGPAILCANVKRCKISVVHMENTAGEGIMMEDDQPTTRNTFTFGRAAALRDVITARSMGANYYNTFHSDELRSEQGDLISHFSECVFYGYVCQAGNGFVASNCHGCKFYNFSLEHGLLGGFRDVVRCMVYGCRTVELTDRNSVGESNAPLVRLTGRNSGNFFYFSGPVPIENIDVSEMYDRAELLENYDTDAATETVGYSANRNVIYGNIQNCSYYWYADHKHKAQLSGYNSDLGGQCILRLGRKIVVPREYVTYRVDYDVLDLRDSTFPLLPTELIIDRACTVILGDSYCSMGIPEVRIDQTNYKVTVKDRTERVIFDGRDRNYGIYTLRFLAQPERYGLGSWENLLRDTVEITREA